MKKTALALLCLLFLSVLAGAERAVSDEDGNYVVGDCHVVGGPFHAPNGGIYAVWICDTGSMVLEHVLGPKFGEPPEDRGPQGLVPVDPDPFGPERRLEV